jgi:AcrR family transcriptional regulator
MGRWEPDSRGRLQEAALALYSERGFDQTTAAEIAARAGVTERTFFRHFTDKREVLFGGSKLLQERILSGVARALTGHMPLEAVARGLDAAAALLGEAKRSGGQLPQGPAPGVGGQESPRLPSADPGGQLPPADHGRQHTAEAARRRRPRPPLPVHGQCAGGALAAGRLRQAEASRWPRGIGTG